MATISPLFLVVNLRKTKSQTYVISFNKVNIRVLFFENCFILRWKIFFKKIFSCTVISQWRRRIVVITTAQLHSSKPELRFCAGSYPARSVSEIQGGEDLWQWSRLEIRLKAFRWSTMPQKQFIIINSSSFAFKAKQQKVLEKWS